MLVFQIIAAALGLVWGAVLLRRTGLFGCFLAFLILAACFGHEFFNFSVGPLPLTSDRVALAALAGGYLVARRKGWITCPSMSWIDGLFIAFLAMLAVNTLTHDWRINGAQPLGRLLFLYLAPGLAYWIIRQLMVDQRHSRWLYGFLVAFGVYLTVTAIAEVNQISAAVFPRYILTSSYKEWIGRARGPFVNPVTNGMFLSASLFALSMSWPRSSRVGKMFVLFGMAFLFLGVYYTLTRSVWIGAAAGLGLIVFLGVRSRFRIPLAIFTILLFGIVLALKGNHLNSFKRDKDVSEFHMAQSAELRPMLAYVAWQMAKDYPLFGVGLGQYKRVDGEYLRDPNIDMPLERLKPFVQHNVFLSMLTETGFVGCGLYVALLCAWSYRAYQLWRTTAPLPVRQFGLVLFAFIANWCLNGLFHDTSLMVNGNLLLFVLAGATQGLYLRAQVRMPSRTPRRNVATHNTRLHPALPNM